ncbi:hypothetical protein CLOLEP_01143 [[Clostridium] leptum DSM 753]|uniref:Uncharacterized protein n=1 Tax=[Clostridium] leptum DSM 753 TaxID=428125 RepID=A7VRG0_9FIRM|nr:hypothetical protein CLOLEP_01143 [[Clostridium] leptum DSM 753]
MRYRYYSTFSFRSCFCRVSSLNIYFSIFPSQPETIPEIIAPRPQAS